MGWEIQAFIASRSYTPASERQRRVILEQFASWCDPLAADGDDLLRWWDGTRHLSASSRRTYLLAVRGFLDWLCRAGHRVGNPAELIRPPTVHRAPPKVLTDEQVEKLKCSLSSDTERLCVGLMLDLGLRVGEVTALDAGDLADGVLRVTGKGGKVANLPMPAHLEPLFHRCVPLGCTVDALGMRVKKWLRRAGVTGHSAHSLRRTAATRWAMSGVPPHVIAALLRHSSLSTSAHYVRVDVADMAAVV
jgi:site-specific recombinase XerD